MKRGKFEAEKSARPMVPQASTPKSTAEKGTEVPVAKSKSAGGKETILVYLHDLVYLFAIIMVLLLVFFRIVVVSGPSMKNTLLDGDYLLTVSSTFYWDPKPGDIVVISKQSFDNGEPIIKRVIATEGQKVDIDFSAGIVYVDDKPLDEGYVNTPTNYPEGVSFPLTVDKGCIFVMGDNRNSSKDSRDPEIGMIDKREVLGKVLFLVFPGTDGGKVSRQFNRIGAFF